MITVWTLCCVERTMR